MSNFVPWLTYRDLAKGARFSFAYGWPPRPTVDSWRAFVKIGRGWYVDSDGRKWRTGSKTAVIRRAADYIEPRAHVIDSRSVIERIDELQGERSAHEDLGPTDESGTILPWESEYPDDAQELKALEALQDEAEGYATDWKYGATLIRDSYFEDYARELAEDIGAIDRNAMWPLRCIDWEQAARELRMDYTSVEFDGVTYWVR